MARPRVSKRSAPGPTTRKENLSSLSTEVLRLRLQALQLPITGSRAQLLSSLKKAATPPSSRPAKQNRVSKRSRGRLPARMTRAEAKGKGVPVDSLVDGDDSELDLSDQVDEDPTPVDLPAHTVEDLLSVPEPVPNSSSPFTSDQLRAIQDTVQSSISEALHGGHSQLGTSVSQVLPRPQLRPSGTASPMGLHRPLEKNLEDKILRGEYVDFTLLLPDSIAHPQSPEVQLRVEDSAPGSLVAPVTMVRKRKPVIDSFHKWLDAYTTYMLVIVAAYPRRALELIKYQQIISRAESKFKGLAWLAYDEQFRRYAASDLTRPWDLVDLELWTVTFSGLAKPHCFVCSSPYHSQADCPKADPTRRQYRGSGSCCFSFNKPSGCNRRSCQFPHVCSRCRSPSHAFPNCTSNGSSKNFAPGNSGDRGKK